MREALERACEGADAVYVTFDVDATDGAFAPGTNSMIFGGLTSGEVLEALAVVGECELVGAFDVSEMLPRFDVGGGRTARLGAHAVLEVVASKVLDSEPGYSREQLGAVLR